MAAHALAETLPLAQRLALSYAPAGAHAPVLALCALEARLAGIVRGPGEPVLAQIKLAWWRERLAEDAARWPAGEPLLELLRGFPGGPGVLVPVVDAWEGLLAETLDPAAFAAGRAAGWAALGGEDARAAARRFALVDLLFHLPPGDEADAVRALLAGEGWAPVRLKRPVRPLAVLHGLAARALRRGSAELLDGPGALFVAMRLGFTGR
jgi:15-cis-phytoene synthase